MNLQPNISKAFAKKFPNIANAAVELNLPGVYQYEAGKFIDSAEKAMANFLSGLVDIKNDYEACRTAISYYMKSIQDNYKINCAMKGKTRFITVNRKSRMGESSLISPTSSKEYIENCAEEFERELRFQADKSFTSYTLVVETQEEMTTDAEGYSYFKGYNIHAHMTVIAGEYGAIRNMTGANYWNSVVYTKLSNKTKSYVSGKTGNLKNPAKSNLTMACYMAKMVNTVGNKAMQKKTVKNDMFLKFIRLLSAKKVKNWREFLCRYIRNGNGVSNARKILQNMRNKGQSYIDNGEYIIDRATGEYYIHNPAVSPYLTS